MNEMIICSALIVLTIAAHNILFGFALDKANKIMEDIK